MPYEEIQPLVKAPKSQIWEWEKEKRHKKGGGGEAPASELHGRAMSEAMGMS